MVAPQPQSIRTPDGGTLAVYSYGTGPGAVLPAGSLTRTVLYGRFASRLSTTIPVHVYDRRGRGRSSPQPADYSMQTELDDLKAVLDATGSSVVLGHSYGGGIALEAALRLPVSRVAVYDPAVNIEGCLPTRMLPQLVDAAARGDHVRAVMVFSRVVDPRMQKVRLPDPASRVLLWAASRLTRDGRAWKEMVPALAQEISLLDSSRAAPDRYGGIAVPVLLLAGANSPRYFHTIASNIAASLSSGTSLIVPRADHGALHHPSETILTLFRRFLGQGV
ncbi:alpha/beta fold hydrolase [Sinomonas mesophila]|uniref:alpha/beta fold hydrolase n=1 Tax=Sinomonas mesophila TaxID=1531955 RepID=UPI0009871F7B|nr:alpha/beta hydrolase [Sinomonas mesophila]